MCTLVLAWQVFADAPVVVAANRDELLDRPSEPPAVRDWEPPAVAPLDAEAVRVALQPEPGEGGEAWLDRAATVIADHEYGVCVHRDGFGTRSSSLLRLGDERVYEFADGPPCRTPYERVDNSI